MVNTVISERKSATTENVKNEGAGDDEGNGEKQTVNIKKRGDGR